jgi:hypothetical protein
MSHSGHFELILSDGEIFMTKGGIFATKNVIYYQKTKPSCDILDIWGNKYNQFLVFQ